MGRERGTEQGTKGESRRTEKGKEEPEEKGDRVGGCEKRHAIFPYLGTFR